MVSQAGFEPVSVNVWGHTRSRPANPLLTMVFLKIAGLTIRAPRRTESPRILC